MHALIAGMSESGKSTLGISLCRELRRRRKLTIVFDPMHDPRWQCADFTTPDPEKFFRVAHMNRSAFLFIDEAGKLGKSNKTLADLITSGRHLGHSCVVMTQRPTQLDPLIRDQCRRAYLFALSEDAMDIFAREMRQPRLLELAPLMQGEYFEVSRFSEISRFKLDFRTGRAYKI